MTPLSKLEGKGSYTQVEELSFVEQGESLHSDRSEGRTLIIQEQMLVSRRMW